MQRSRLIVDRDAACLDGHFPGHPVVPGVVLLDAAIDAFALPAPMRIVQVKFLQPCLPGMALELNLIRTGGTARLQVEHEGRIMAMAQLELDIAVPEHG